MVHEGITPEGLLSRDDMTDELGPDGFFRGHYDTDPIVSSRNSKFLAVVRPQEALKEERTLISKQWHYVMPISLISYILLQAILNTQSAFCNIHDPFANWTFEVGIGVASCFGLSLLYNFTNGYAVESWAQKETEHLRAVYASAATMSFIAGTSTVLYLTNLGDAICIDALGMETPNCQWPEWLVAAPLLVYIAIAIEDKPSLTVEDYGIIILMFLCILFGFVMNFFVDLVWGIILFILSSLCMVGNIVLVMKAVENEKNHESSKLLAHQWILERMRMKSKLAQLLFWLLPLFVFVYILGIVHILDRDEIVVANMLIGLVTKLFFVSTLSMESVVMQFASERKVNDRRRQFLRYVFHEVRVPLNTITMGITVLKDDAIALDESSREVVEMMDAAAGFMNSTLNDVLSMSKIEDGAISLVVKAFTLISLLETAMRAVRSLASNKAVRIIVKGLSRRDEARSLTVLGDEGRLQLVLVNFLSNAVKFSVAGSVVTIEVGSAQKLMPRKLSEYSSVKFLNPLRKNSNSRRLHMSFKSKPSRIQQSPSKETKQQSKESQIRYVTVLVNDVGAGIPEDDHGKLFQAFAQIRPHDLEGKGGRGSGLGLVMAKEIIDLHGGEVLFKSELGVGSSFGFVIPFPVVEVFGVQQSTRSRSVNRADPNYVSGPSYTHNKSKFLLPSLSGRLVPVRHIAQEMSLDIDDPRSSPNFSGRNVVSPSPLDIPLGTKMDMILAPEIPEHMDSGSVAMISLDTATYALSPLLKNDTGSPVRVDSISDVSAMGFHEEGSGSAALSETSASIVKCISGNTSVSGSDKRCFISSPGGRIAPDTGLSLSRGLTSVSRTTSQMSIPLLGVEMAGATRSVSEKTEKKMSFLLVDDTASNCKMLKMLLNKKGIECDMAFNGREAVDAYKRALSDSCVRRAATIYEVIFMDYTMPIMNGLEATEAIRALGFSGLIIGLTGNALDDDVANFIKSGADCVFSKPFREEHLASLLAFIADHGCESSDKSHSLIKPDQKKFFP